MAQGSMAPSSRHQRQASSLCYTRDGHNQSILITMKIMEGVIIFPHESTSCFKIMFFVFFFGRRTSRRPWKSLGTIEKLVPGSLRQEGLQAGHHQLAGHGPPTLQERKASTFCFTFLRRQSPQARRKAARCHSHRHTSKPPCCARPAGLAFT